MIRIPTLAARRAAALGLVLALGGCSIFVPQRQEPVATAPPKPQLLPPLASHTFPYDPKTTAVLGELQVTYARDEDTIPDIARRFNLGFDEVARANPGVDPWLPGEATRIVLPTQFVLPDAPHEGVVINVAALRMFYFPKPAKDQPRVVLTYPIGIGKVGWATPIGKTKVVSKRKDPWWTPPASVRKEHAAEGDPLPARVPPGPDNPLGAYAMNLGWTSYLIHGTNKPAGVGLRASHGCIRMYPEDIAAVFERIPVGTPVTVVNQPLVHRWHGDSLYVQAYPPHEEDGKKVPAQLQPQLSKAISDKMAQRAKQHGGAIDWPLTERVVKDAQGVAVPVTRHGTTLESFLASARLVENALPAGSNWDGRDPDEETEEAAKPVADTGARGGR
ncbi:MAG: L,D-transpeptidase family protein [Steroidobacteraceae bacterium]